jgi:hypothetical protein
MFFSRAVKTAQNGKENADEELQRALDEHAQVMVEKEEVRISLHRVIRTRNRKAVESTAYLMTVKDEPEEEEVQAVSA